MPALTWDDPEGIALALAENPSRTKPSGGGP